MAGVRACAPAFAAPGAPLAEVVEGWRHFFGLSHREPLGEELAAAQRDFEANPTPDAERRVLALREAQNRLNAGETDPAGNDGEGAGGNEAHGHGIEGRRGGAASGFAEG